MDFCTLCSKRKHIFQLILPRHFRCAARVVAPWGCNFSIEYGVPCSLLELIFFLSHFSKYENFTRKSGTYYIF